MPKKLQYNLPLPTSPSPPSTPPKRPTSVMQPKFSGAGEGVGTVTAKKPAFSPADIGPPMERKEEEKRKEAKDPKAIWDDDEVDDAGELDTVDDGRKRPVFDILYKQDVGTEDVYLGLGEKDPSSSSCKFLVAKIQLPGETLSEIDLDVKKQSITVLSPKFKLSTYLPHPVKFEEGKARWDSKKELLSVVLPLSRGDLISRLAGESEG